ncbi:D-cysteine desulfhydrase family protein [Pseudohalocynthiibacter aestuariivivens]|jgi:1-aminocyclopropane-1-carboxylate deaminase/D-cysteine desulfhydrase-like pyridoxal-dependent ACC family enzyme|uniref:D-cysteine desulfhydrase family protein n=1 Tax=Pseudohalocynthiibacter aestuariivivens TaxID=1591409 RepID=A0ABV5JID2_9RHOB|nr:MULTISPECIES: D-cysteine desulfhydrase family protein [Pseudohalocynthiibacter]MBS9717525.1 D-cysteine desulfhydrase family protein [Pseudohalocynthiibacter aestuariivivens]MCK0102139.1 D-cysteine desulfhydrase family protein [Pseudohalocynthiibacter sp. F2068]
MSTNFQQLTQVLPELENHPRAPLFSRSSDLEPLHNLGQHLGIKLDAKRDDSLPLAMGGNKVRQLEYYLGQAVEQKADTVLITGAVQSNFVRLCAAAARKLGMRPILQLEDRVPKDDVAYNTSGNVLLLKLMGGEIEYFPEGENESAADANLDRMAAGIAAEGGNPFVIHLGINHPPIGALGYAAAAVETWLQHRALGEMPDHVVVPSGSGLTHAGFLVGARAIGWDVSVLGICVRRDATQQSARILRRANEVAELLGGKVTITEADVQVDDTSLAPGYGQMNAQVLKAITSAAEKEALLLDPVYSGRTMAGLLDHLESGVIKPGEHVTFIHTGGTPAIFAYQSDLQ